MYKSNLARIAIVAGFMAAIASGADKIPADATGPYDNVVEWLKPVAPGRYVYPLTVFAQSPDRIFIGIGGTSAPLDPKVKYDGDSWSKEYPDARSDHKVFVVDHTGKIVEQWSQWDQQIQWPHRIRINPYDPEKHVWIIDRQSQQILEFTNDGKKLLRTLGERGVAGTDHGHFGRPTDIDWLPDGTFFISDGYDNSRVVKFDKNGKYLLEWGTKGTGPGQFNLVHALAIGANHQVYVVDRNNQRIQVFDENGKFIKQWPVDGRPTAMIVDAQQNAWVLEGNPGGKIGKHDASGKYLASWGAQGDFPGTLIAAHDFSVDSAGAVYVSMSPVHRVDKFVPKQGADKALLVQPRYVEKTGNK
jgi:WD40 repeat protein